MEAIIEVNDLVKEYDGVTAVNGISFAVERGEIFGFLGPNGAGKTTTINILCTLLKPTAGSAVLDGCEVVKNRDRVRESIGLVFQDPSLDDRLTARENLEFHAYAYRVPRDEKEARIREVLEMVELLDREKDRVMTFSGGMKRRLEIARGLLHRPRVLFLDEPTIGLDPAARRAVWEYIGQLRERFGTTVLLTTHQMEEADLLCHKVAIMHQGRLVALGSPRELRSSIGRKGATLEDVFIHYTGSNLDSGGTYRETRRTRRSAARLG
jgi:ABC-2 type transport system ATP-binding protein